MCEVHVKRCTGCGDIWEEHRKLASCEHPSEQDSRCPPSLCMHVGSPRRPVRAECEPCREAREIEELEQVYGGGNGGGNKM